MTDSVMPSYCSHMTAPMELATHYTTPDTIVEISTKSATVEQVMVPHIILVTYDNIRNS